MAPRQTQVVEREWITYLVDFKELKDTLQKCEKVGFTPHLLSYAHNEYAQFVLCAYRDKTRWEKEEQTLGRP